MVGDVEKEEQDPSDSIEQKENAPIASTIIKAEEAASRVNDDQRKDPTIMAESLKGKESLQKKIKLGDGSHIEAEDR